MPTYRTPPEMVEFFLPVTDHRTATTAGQYVGLPGKIGNANTEAPTVQSGLYTIVLMGQSFIVLFISTTVKIPSLTVKRTSKPAKDNPYTRSGSRW